MPFGAFHEARDGTYIGIGAFIGSWADECDEFMAPFVDDKAAHCTTRRQGRG